MNPCRFLFIPLHKWSPWSDPEWGKSWHTWQDPMKGDDVMIQHRTCERCNKRQLRRAS